MKEFLPMKGACPVYMRPKYKAGFDALLKLFVQENAIDKLKQIGR